MSVESLALGRLSLPDRSGRGNDEGPLPGVVFIHDVWGPSPHSEAFADRLAGLGFAVLAVDFYRDLATGPGDDPGAFIRGLSDPSILADVASGVEALSQRPECEGGRIGVTGVCMGGMYALLSACRLEGIAAAAPFYGMLSFEHGMLMEPEGMRDPSRKPASPLEAAPDLRCPLLAFFGEDDDFIPMDDVEMLRGRLARTGHASEVVVYPAAGHAFMNETRAAAFRPESARDAWHRLADFLKTHLS